MQADCVFRQSFVFLWENRTTDLLFVWVLAEGTWADPPAFKEPLQRNKSTAKIMGLSIIKLQLHFILRSIFSVKTLQAQTFSLGSWT